MKKILLSLLAISTLFISCGTKKTSNKFTTIDAGKAVITNIDSDKKAVKFNQTVNGEKNVTVIDCSKSTARNFVNVNLADYESSDIDFDFSCDLMVQNSADSSTEITWIINEPSAGIPEIAKQRIPSNTWTHFAGHKQMSLSENKAFYISGAGLKKENLKIYIKNFKLTIRGDQIGKKKIASVSWTKVPSLAKAYENYFDYIGFATPLNGVLDNADVVNGLEYQASCYTMENEFKPDFMFGWQTPRNFQKFIAEDGNVYDVPGNTPVFDNVNRILMTAKNHNLKMRGHVLVWHSQTPDWFFRQNYGGKSDALVDEATMNARMEWYIKTILEYIKAWEVKNNNGERIVITWDVVNEAASDNPSNLYWLRTDSNWFRIYQNDTFIVNAFRYANKYAPKDVLLAYNDYGCSSPAKCGAICKIVDAIQAAPDARIDVVGMQAHIGMGTPISGPFSFETSVEKFLEKGVDVQVTELDIGSDGQSYNSEYLKIKYHDFFAMCLKNRKTETKNGIRGITLWGIIDERSWIYNNNGAKQHPLLFERDYMCKPAFYGVLEAAQEADK